MFQSQIMKKYWTITMGAVVALYMVLLIAISAYSQQRSYQVAVDGAQKEFEAQVRVLSYDYLKIYDSLNQLSGLTSIQAFYANQMLGMSYQYGLSGSLHNIAQDIRTLLLNDHQHAIIRHVKFKDSDSGYQKAVNMGPEEPLCLHEYADSPRLQSRFIGQVLCQQIPVFYKGRQHGVLQAELSARIFDIRAFASQGSFYLQDLSGSYWRWDRANSRWSKVDTGPVDRDDRFLFSSAIGTEGFTLHKSLPAPLIISFTQTTEFVFALFGLAILILVGGFQAFRDRLQNKVLNSLVDKEREHVGILSQANQQLEREMARRETLEKQLSYRAQHDLLTGLPNRDVVISRIDESIRRAGKSEKPLAVVFCDLDRFKQVNDTLGHDAGDTLITYAAERLKSVVKESDTVSRFGGDEFLLLLENVSCREDVAQTCEKLVEEFNHPFTLQDHEFTVTCSVGVAIFPDDSRDSAGLIKQADTALYEAKENGRAAYCFYRQSLNTALQSRLSIEQKLLSRDWSQLFHLVYQPIVSLETGEVDAVEALLRWQSDCEEDEIGPETFIPVAEDLGLVGDIGEWVLRQVARDYQRFARHSVRVFVNISPLQFVWKKPLVELVREVCAEEGMPLQSLGLEVTESSLVRNVIEVKRTLDELSAEGVSLAIDDFGTGYSSLSYLKRFPFNRIKIDKSFVRDLCDDSSDQELVRAIIAMARAMRLRVIAEGVESCQQQGLLKDLGCDYIQGYYYSRPAPVDRVISYCDSLREALPA